MGDKDEVSDSHDDQLHEVPALVMDFVDMVIGEENPTPLDQPQGAPVTPVTNNAEDAGAGSVTSGTLVRDYHHQTLIPTTECDTESEDAKESFSETCQSIFGCGPSTLPGSHAGTPSSIPESQEDSPSSTPGSHADTPSSIPESQDDRPSSSPGSHADTPSSIPESQDDRPSSSPGSHADTPSSIPESQDDRPSSTPGSHADTPSSIPESQDDRPSSPLGSHSNRPCYVPGSHADNPFYLPGPHDDRPYSLPGSRSDSSSTSYSSPASASSWSYGSSSSGCSLASGVSNINQSDVSQRNQSTSSDSFSGSDEPVPRYTADTIQYQGIADKQSNWKVNRCEKEPVWNYFEQKVHCTAFVSPKKETNKYPTKTDAKPCAAFNHISYSTEDGVSHLKSPIYRKDVRPKIRTAGLRGSGNGSQDVRSSPTDNEDVRLASSENEQEMRLLYESDPPVYSERGNECIFKMEVVSEEYNSGQEVKSDIDKKEISSTIKENDQRTSPKSSRGTTSDQAKYFKRNFPIPTMTRRNNSSPGVFVSPVSFGKRRTKRLSGELTGSDNAIGVLCMSPKKAKTDTPATSCVRKRLGKWLK
ncbi:uncharacterized protein LOC124144825 [Haliotis rufescens]|uniref:uncharacterized protein LOC124144825 n=1 Tax=Haliotis rufescens TaxID=6454 RepID=UPI00201EE046|nr:uncharacterized protein LOC124144825 [Haliotis rufescens]